jgi:hypothetical protein
MAFCPAADEYLFGEKSSTNLIAVTCSNTSFLFLSRRAKAPAPDLSGSLNLTERNVATVKIGVFDVAVRFRCRL